MEGGEPDRWRLGDVVFDRTDGSIWRDGRRVDLTPKQLGILSTLVGAAPRSVTKEQLLDSVWPEAVVGEAALAQRVKELRRLLGDDARNPRFIETVARRGYRLKATLARLEDGSPGAEPIEARAQGAEQPAAAGSSRGLPRGLVGLIALLVAALGWVIFRDVAPTELPQAPAVSAVPSPFRARRGVGVAVAERGEPPVGAAWAGPVIAEMLTAELGAGGVLRTVNAGRVAEASRDLCGRDVPVRAALPRLRQLLGLDLVVVGRYRVDQAETEEVLWVWLEVRRASDGSVDGVLEERVPLAEIGELPARLGGRLRAMCGVPPAAEADAALERAAFPVGASAARSYGEGLSALRTFDFPRATAALEAAVSAESHAVAARLALAHALQWSGQRGRALAEFDRCLRDAASLPRELQLVIEADYRELNGEWERAAEINRSLLVLYPDNLESGLSLATLLASHGNERSAEAVLDQLRRLPLPLGSDPRIELARAWMHESDLMAKLTAASRAAEQSRSIGATLLLAAARIQQGRALRGLGKPEEALEAFNEAWRLREQAGDQSGVGKALRHVALVERDEGDLVAAQAHLESARAIFLRIGDVDQLAEALRESADLAIDQGQSVEASRLLAQAEAVRPSAVPSGVALSLAILRARLALLTATPAEAVASARAAVDISRGESLSVARVQAHGLLAVSLLRAGELKAAEAEVRIAEDLSSGTDDRAARLEIATAAQNVANALGQCGRARRSLERTLAEVANAPLRLQLEAQFALAACAVMQGEPGSDRRLAELEERVHSRGFGSRLLPGGMRSVL